MQALKCLDDNELLTFNKLKACWGPKNEAEWCVNEVLSHQHSSFVALIEAIPKENTQQLFERTVIGDPMLFWVNDIILHM